eukprot:6420789-Alexandrium_andersonii.AAC.1
MGSCDSSLQEMDQEMLFYRSGQRWCTRRTPGWRATTSRRGPTGRGRLALAAFMGMQCHACPLGKLEPNRSMSTPSL